MRRKVGTLKQSNSTNTATQFATLNSTLGFLEQLFKTSGCLIKLCDTLVDGPVLRKKKKKESSSSILVSIAVVTQQYLPNIMTMFASMNIYLDFCRMHIMIATRGALHCQKMDKTLMKM